MRRNFTVPYRPKRRQNTSLAGWVNWMQKWNRFISTSDRSDFYRTNVFILKHSHCSKQLTSLCLNSKSQICQNWKWIHFILHSIDSAREASENTFAVRQLEFSANITIVGGLTRHVDIRIWGILSRIWTRRWRGAWERFHVFIATLTGPLGSWLRNSLHFLKQRLLESFEINI